MNKTIFILWFQGIEHAPDLVKRCVDSWKKHNSNWNIIFIDNANIKDYICVNDYIDVENKHIELCHLSDIIRGLLLQKYGGVWADATTFCNKPLDDWLPFHMNEGFFVFEKPCPERIISNWFIYAEKDSYIMNTWSDATIDYYREHDHAEDYFIHHSLFAQLHHSDERFTTIWNKVPKLQATGISPHYIQHKGMFNEITAETKSVLDSKVVPFYKLTHKTSFPSYDETKLLYYLYSIS